MSQDNKRPKYKITQQIDSKYQYPKVAIYKEMGAIEIIDQCEATGKESILLLEKQRGIEFRLQPIYKLSMQGKKAALEVDSNQIVHPKYKALTLADMEYRYAQAIEHLEGLVRDCVEALQVCSATFDKVPSRHKGTDYSFVNYIGEHHIEKADHYIEKAIGRVAVSNMDLVKPLTGPNLSTGTTEEQEIDAWVAKYSSTEP